MQSLKHATNEELLHAYQQLDIRAFEEFYRRNSPILHSFLRSRLGSVPEADDALQDTFFRIHKYIASYSPAQSALSWSFGIARNVAIDRIKGRLKHKTNGSAELENIPAPTPDLADNELEGLLALLTKDERAIITDRFLKEETYEKIAADRSISEQSARQKVSRIIKKIKSRP